MYQEHYLSELLPGEWATVLNIRYRGEIKRRLEDLGFTKGCRVSCAFSSFAEDPIAYRLRGTLIALRKKDASRIVIRKGGVIHEKSS